MWFSVVYLTNRTWFSIDYRATIHRQTGNQTTTRQVDEAFSKLMPEDIQQLETSEVVKEAIKTLGKAVEHHIPSRNETI